MTAPTSRDELIALIDERIKAAEPRQVEAAKSDEVVKKLDELDGGDPEGAHWRADELLLSVAPKAVRGAYERAQSRVGFWYA